jgi:DNA uptake protein ComE-like DNA-binding protein
MAIPPARSPEDIKAALEKAAAARAAMAEVKAKLKNGSLTLASALEQSSSDPAIGKLKVTALLQSLPGVGKVKAKEIMETLEIADNRRVQGLGNQQRKALLERLS